MKLCILNVVYSIILKKGKAESSRGRRDFNQIGFKLILKRTPQRLFPGTLPN